MRGDFLSEEQRISNIYYINGGEKYANIIDTSYSNRNLIPRKEVTMCYNNICRIDWDDESPIDSEILCI